MTGKKSLLTAALGGALLFGGIFLPAGTAQARDNCVEKIRSEQFKLDRDIRRHGVFSRQAEHRRHKLRRLHERCGSDRFFGRRDRRDRDDDDRWIFGRRDRRERDDDDRFFERRDRRHRDSDDRFFERRRQRRDDGFFDRRRDQRHRLDRDIDDDDDDRRREDDDR